MKRPLVAIGLEIYALQLAFLQLGNGVRTDEAKYLLDIPYPHPPLARSIMGLTDGWMHHELFWRIVCATLLVQSVWFVMHIARRLSPWSRGSLLVAWLLSAAVVFQGGTVMMAPLTAVFGLVFVWLLLKERAPDPASAGLIALVWLASLFTAYQGILFAPLVWAVLHRSNQRLSVRLFLWTVPVVLLALYTLSNPLAAASMFIHAGKDALQLPVDRLTDTAFIAGIGGSIVLSIVGTIGLLWKPRAGLIISLLLVTAYVLLSRFEYYAILFTPLFIAGAFIVVSRFPVSKYLLLIGVPVATVVLCFLYPPVVEPSPVPSVLQELNERAVGEGIILIRGQFGHEWQHASWSPIRRYHSTLLEDAKAVICLEPCDEVAAQPKWAPLAEMPLSVWIRSAL